MPLTDCDWMALHLEVLYRADALGRLLSRREPGDTPPPRFHLGRTYHGNIWRLRGDLPSAAVRQLSRLAGRESALLAGMLPPPLPERIRPIRETLAEVHEVEDEWRGPAYRFVDRRDAWDHLRSLASGASSLDPSDPVSLGLLRRDFPMLADTIDCRVPCLAWIEGDHVRSVCYSACAEPGGAAEAGVETRPEDRGQGLASRCVAAWALAIRERGGTPLYSTRWENRGSRAVAEKLGLEIYGEDLSFT